MPKKNWKLKSRSIPSSPNTDDAIHPVIAALLELRGIMSAEDRERFIAPDYDRDLHDPFLFRDMPRVMERIRQAIVRSERVGVYGDFDADGVTSSVLMREGLEALGLDCTVYIPDKDAEGHGLHRNALDAFNKGSIRLVFTVDCGMMSHDEIDDANARGMDVIVIDHHHVPELLPHALAIINPKLPGETYPFKELCGAGTTFKLLQALYATFIPDRQDELKWLLDVAAVGTVADVMPLVGENRVIVAYGLIVLGKTRREGLRELMENARLPIGGDRPPVARDIAFQIAPRINAAGRMAHAKMAHDLLMEKRADEVRRLASELESHNDQRRKVTEEMTAIVRDIAAAQPERRTVFAVREDFHLGIVGLVAGKVAHEFVKPSIVLVRGEEESRGSLRSVPGIHIAEVLQECSDILIRHGGHAAAAGLSVRNEHLGVLEDRIERAVKERLGSVPPEPELVAEFVLPPGFITRDLARSVARLAPFGEGNPEPIFWGEGLIVESVRFVGSGEKHMKFTLRDPVGSSRFDGIGFSLGERFGDLAAGEYIDAMFTLDENVWNGRSSVQLKIIDIRRSGV